MYIVVISISFDFRWLLLFCWCYFKRATFILLSPNLIHIGFSYSRSLSLIPALFYAIAICIASGNSFCLTFCGNWLCTITLLEPISSFSKANRQNKQTIIFIFRKSKSNATKNYEKDKNDNEAIKVAKMEKKQAQEETTIRRRKNSNESIEKCEKSCKYIISSEKERVSMHRQQTHNYVRCVVFHFCQDEKNTIYYIAIVRRTQWTSIRIKIRNTSNNNNSNKWKTRKSDVLIEL